MRLIPALLLSLPFLVPAHAQEAGTPHDPVAASAASAGTLPPATAEQGAEPGSGPWIYMVARVKLTGTDFTQVVLFRHNAITTLDECEAERTAGLTTGWNYFSRYYLKTLKGISYKVDYRCVQGDQQLAHWRQGAPLDNFYLVRTQDKTLIVQPHRNFFACRDALRQISADENIDAFCAISSQATLAK